MSAQPPDARDHGPGLSPSPSGIVATYVVCSAAWILLSDRLITLLTPDTQVLSILATAKGWLFVAVTGTLLLILLHRREQTLRKSKEVAQAGGEEARQLAHDLARVNRALRTLSEADRALVRAHDERTMLDELCRVVVEEGGYRLAWIGFAEHDEARTVRPVAQAGLDDGFVDGISISWADTDLGRGPTGTAIRTGQPTVARDTVADPAVGAWRQPAIARGFRSSIALPITVEGVVLGALSIYASETDAFDEPELRLLGELAEDLGYAISAGRARRAREQAEEAFRHERDLRDRMVETSPLAIVAINRDGRIVFANASAEEMMGVSVDTITERTFDATEWQIATEDGRPVPPEELPAARVLASGIPLRHYSHAIMRPDGTRVLLSINAAPLHDRDGRVDGVVTTIEDITERRAAERALERSEELLRAVLEATPAGILLVDREGQILVANAHAARLLGTEQGLIGRSVESYLPLQAPLAVQGSGGPQAGTLRENQAATDPPLAGDAMVGASAVLDGAAGSVYIPEAEARRPDGTTLPVEVRGEQVVAGGEKLWVIVAYDLSERRRLEEQQRHNQRLEALGRLAGGVAHDFNNLLTAIQGFSEIALATMPEGGSRDDVQQISKAAQRAALLTRQLLAFSRQQSMEPRVLELDRHVGDMEPMLRRVLGEDIVLRASLGAGATGLVRADPGQLDQVLVNLAVNARDAMPSGGTLVIETASVHLDAEYTSLHPELRPGPHVMLSVSDTGTGMDAMTRAHLFEPFFTTKAPGVGTGLGLSTVHGIVRQSGGSIWVYSEPGHGSVFRVYLPRWLGTGASAGESPATAPDHRGAETVLVVDDDDSVRAVTRRTLEQQGYVVLEAGSGVAALRVAVEHPGAIQLVVTDAVMPGMTGPEMAAQFRGLRPGIPVLFISGYAPEPMVHRGFLPPGAEFLEKPFSPARLLQRVRELLDADPASRGDPGPTGA